MLWFRVDELEPKDEREALYREYFMARKCVLCRGSLREEIALKCSHRACRPCMEALVNCGGECVICNPPMFYLFRFRSGDSKSVSEAFLKGTRVFMRTSAARTLHQFSHTPIEPRKWYHAAFVHSRQRFQSSTVSFYLNGVLQETVKMSYPASITSGQPLSSLIGTPSQAQRQSSSAWTVRAFYLVDEPISAFAANTVFAAGPRYDGLFSGATGNSELAVCFDHLSVRNLAVIDEYMRDPLRALIESVDAERVSKNSFLRGSFSLASAASSAAAAIVQDMKSDAGLFARLPSAVPLINIPIQQDRVLLAYSSRNALGVDSSIIPSTRLDGRPIAQMMGGTAASTPLTIGDVLYDLSSSTCQVAYILLESASTTRDMVLALRLLWSVMQGNAANLEAMEQEHGYGIVSYLLHQKASFLDTTALQLLFRIVGIDTEEEVGNDDQVHRETASGSESRERSIRNLQALQYFVLDYSLWQKVDKETQRFLFSSLYSCLVAGDEDLRERNRVQLQSLSIVRQLLYVFLDPNVEPELLRVIVDLILVCLTGIDRRDSSLETNFADVASFLTCSRSLKFFAGTSNKELGSFGRRRALSAAIPSDVFISGTFSSSSNAEQALATLSLSPRGGKQLPRTARFFGGAKSSQVFDVQINDEQSDVQSSVQWKQQGNIQDLLLDMLHKAVQKHDLKESKERDEADGTVTTASESGSGASTPTFVTGRGGSTSGTSGSTTVSRIQLPSSHRLTGFRKALSPRWISYFLFPTSEAFSSTSVPVAPSTVILALKLLCALLSQPRYEAYFNREGYYQLLAQRLPCNQGAFRAVSTSSSSGSDGCASPGSQRQFNRFPFDKMWYTLFCILLGTPVDGIPHSITFEMFFLTKDFELNIQSDRILNPNIVCVILGVMRRYYGDPVALAALQQSKREGGNGGGLFQREKTRFSGGIDSDRMASEEATHTQVLAFLHHLYVKMPALHKLLATGSDKFRSEILEELTLLACVASRHYVTERYAPSRKQIHQALLSQKREVNAYEAAMCAVTLAEEAASKDASGHDPFSHPSAAGALRILVDMLMNFLLDHPRGNDVVETLFDGAVGADLLPPLHEGLHLQFQSLVLLGLVAQIQDAFSNEEIFAQHKLFAQNLRDFLKLTVQKMHSWQRAQHGDACPPAFGCCGKVHFGGGPTRLLEFTLFVLAETSIGIVGSGGGSGFSVFSSAATTSIGGMIQDKLNKGKKRRQIRQIIGRMSLSKPAELESLLETLYATLNAVILHMLHGHKIEVSDSELAAMLQLVHLNRDVVLGSRNKQDKDFFVCLCRYLLLLLSDDSSAPLQEAAVHVWVDLLYFQRSFMVELLTVEIRCSGALPYSVNLMKSGFDALLECPSTELAQADQEGGEPSALAINSPGFITFKKWLELVGPPLKELEMNLDRTFLKSIIEVKESVREIWTAYHKKAAARAAKHARRFKTVCERLDDSRKSLSCSLHEAQQKEFRRQVKWRQDRIDRQKFITRQWQHIKFNLLQHALGDGITEKDACLTALSNPAMMSDIAIESSSRLLAARRRAGERDTWRLDFTEGPLRMRKRFIMQRHHVSTGDDDQDDESYPVSQSDLSLSTASPQNPQVARRTLRRRRYSESDLTALQGALRAPSLEWHQLSAIEGANAVNRDTSADRSKLDDIGSDRRRYASFEDLKLLDESSSIRSSHAVDWKNDSLDSDDDESEDREDGERSGTFLQNGVDSSSMGENVVDEKLRPLLVPGDEIMDMYDCLRIDGMDSCPGVFILCNDHAYIVDNYQRLVSQQRGGSGFEVGQTRVVEVSKGAPTRLERGLSLRHRHSRSESKSGLWGAEITLSGSSCTTSSPILFARSSFTHQCRFWSYDDIVELHKRRYQLRHVALEIFAHDGRNYLVRYLACVLLRTDSAF